MQKEKILIVDDSEMNRSILIDMLEDGYEILEAEDGEQALEVIRENEEELSLVLLDIVMPKKDGFDVLREMNREKWIQNIPVIIISSESGSTQVEKAFEMGATDYIPRPFDFTIVRRRVMNTLLLYAKQKRLINMVQEQVYEKERHSDLMIDILSQIMEFRNGESGEHILHVRVLTDLLLGYLSQKTDRYGLSMSEISIISTASALHDIGKLAIDEKILNKPGRLTAEEFEIMKSHTVEGAKMLSSVPVHQQESLLKAAYQICRWHHERWDGKGYPDGLKGDEIPIAAQVVSLADVYDALISKRVYKPAFSHEQAIAMIVRGDCGAFNPLLLECMTEHEADLKTALQRDASEDIRRRKLYGISEETLQGEGTASQRTLRLLDKERMRNSFFASLAEEIQFEYTSSTHMLTISTWGAKKLGLPEIIMEPAKDEKLHEIMDNADWKELSSRLYATTPQKPEVRMDCFLHYEGAGRWHRLIARALWSDDSNPEFEGAFGTVLDIHDAQQKMEELQQKASRDPLTDLFNRGGAKEQIERQLREHPDSNYCLVMFDVDNLKTANDTYGHQFGDRVIKYVADALRRSIRGSDISCRLGGDEFLIFLEYRTEIERTVDRIFHSLCGQVGIFPVTISMGAALGSVTGLSYEALYSAADTALYAAKQRGRNQYCFYDRTMGHTLQDAFSEQKSGQDSKERKEERV